MRFFMLSSIVMSVILLSACGQTGALQLKSDPDYDHRAKYLIQPKSEQSPSEVESSTKTVQE